MDKIMEMVQKRISESIDSEIIKTILGIAGCGNEEVNHSIDYVINEIERARAIITDVIICNENTKKQFDRMDIPKTVEIIPQNYLKDSEIYAILDNDLKFALLKIHRRDKKQKASD